MGDLLAGLIFYINYLQELHPSAKIEYTSVVKKISVNGTSDKFGEVSKEDTFYLLAFENMATEGSNSYVQEDMTYSNFQPKGMAFGNEVRVTETLGVFTMYKFYGYCITIK